MNYCINILLKKINISCAMPLIKLIGEREVEAIDFYQYWWLSKFILILFNSIKESLLKIINLNL